MKTWQENLREATYNATVIDITRVNSHLGIYKISLGDKNHFFEPGQFINIGLFNFERSSFNGTEADSKLIKRPYSISQTPLQKSENYYELYIAKVDNGEFTPDFFELNKGAKLYCTEKSLGVYGLAPLKNSDTVIFASTGTGLAPHLAMLNKLLAGGHQGKILLIDCVRLKNDLAYSKDIFAVVEKYKNVSYLPLATREDITKRYIQDYFIKNSLETEFGVKIDASNTHVYLCGNPAMIGIPKMNRDTNEYEFPIAGGLIEILMKQFAFKIYKHKEGTGNIHFEKYW